MPQRPALMPFPRPAVEDQPDRAEAPVAPEPAWDAKDQRQVPIPVPHPIPAADRERADAKPPAPAAKPRLGQPPELTHRITRARSHAIWIGTIGRMQIQTW